MSSMVGGCRFLAGPNKSAKEVRTMVLKRAKGSAAKSSKGGKDMKLQASSYNTNTNTNANNNSFILIDYPTDGELLNGVHYAIRIGASGDGNCQISFDGQNWNDCRQVGGYWWYDWTYFLPGSYKINARLVDKTGKVLKKTATRCKVA